jgi:hypothetical protein
MEKLFNGVATQHGVDVTLVREYRLRRDVLVDSAAILVSRVKAPHSHYLFSR